MYYYLAMSRAAGNVQGCEEKLAYPHGSGHFLLCGECRKATQPLQGEVFSSLEAACAEQKERSGFELSARRSSGEESRAAFASLRRIVLCQKRSCPAVFAGCRLNRLLTGAVLFLPVFSFFLPLFSQTAEQFYSHPVCNQSHYQSPACRYFPILSVISECQIVKISLFVRRAGRLGVIPPR